MPRIQLAAALAGLVLSVAPVGAQVSGRVTGSVLDATGASVAGATVQIFLPGGESPAYSGVTSDDGFYRFTGIRPDTYDLVVQAPGFSKTFLRGLKVDAAQELTVPVVSLQLESVQQTVDVAANIQTVQTSNAEVSTTVSNEQVRKLPVLDRQVLGLLTTQAGVTDGRGPTVINGMRVAFANVTLDGINIQDNLFRDNSLSFSPNRLAIDQVAEITVSTSNAAATVGGGSAQVNLVTPSGGNQFHGSAYWYNRNSAFAANDWFNNADGVDKPFLNQNQFGGSIGGPVRKDKLFFFFNYEGYRRREQALANRTLLTEDARRGIFTWRDAAGNVSKSNILQLTGSAADAEAAKLLNALPSASLINNFRLGDSRPGYTGNTGGYSFNLRQNEDRNNYTSKVDYWLSPKHSLAGTYIRNRAQTDRSDLANDYAAIPNVFTEGGGDLLSVAWRWTPASNWTNEFRGGFNRTLVDFIPRNELPGYYADGLLFSNPVNTFVGEGRKTNSYVLQNNASAIVGRHNLQMGFQALRMFTSPYNSAGIVPTYTLGISVNNPSGIRPGQLPGATTNDLNNANTLLSNLAGYISGFDQDFNVTGRDSGFVPGQTQLRNFNFHNYSGYFSDTWKVNRRLTLSLGVRYEYYTRVDERDGLMIMPQTNGRSYVETVLSNSVIDFVGSAVGKPLHNRDANNWAPNVGLAWDLFGNGRTALRAGYAVNFVNDGHIASLRNSTNTNDGLTATSSQDGLFATLSGRPSIPTPQFAVPRTIRDNFLINPAASATGLVDPTLVTPYVQQWNIGVQHEVRGTIFEGRYLGNKGTKLFRAFDFNQVVVRENGFLDDFIRARQNGFLAQQAGLGFDPRYNANVPGSQQLTVFPQLGNGGNLTNATNRALIQQGQAAELASRYFTALTPGSGIFFRNPDTLGANVMTNYSNSTYHAFQFDVRRRTRSGLQYQGNYSFAKVLSDSLGERQTRFDPFLDFNNAGIEKSRAPFDITHAFKANAVYELPFGEGKRFNYRPLSRVMSGWTVGTNMVWQSGTAFSILSARGTVNRAGIRSNSNTVDSPLNFEQLTSNVVGLYMTPDGPFFINPSAKAADGRGVGADGAAPFNGQAFFNPQPGLPGSLQRRQFSGPWNFNLDFAVQKLTRITERQSIEIRMEAFNFTNTPTFYVGDEAAATTRFNVNSTTFGSIISTYTDARRIQFGLYYRF